MPKRAAAFLTLFVLCLALPGCGTGYPFYTLGGSPESRTVEIHLDDKTIVKVPCGSGVGAGLTQEDKAAMMAGEEVIIEQDKAKVTMYSKGGPIFLVKAVRYDGKPVLYHEPLL